MEEGSSACWERDLKTRYLVITLLIRSQIGDGVAALTQIHCLLFCRLRFFEWTLAICHS